MKMNPFSMTLAFIAVVVIFGNLAMPSPPPVEVCKDMSGRIVYGFQKFDTGAVEYFTAAQVEAKLRNPRVKFLDIPAKSVEQERQFHKTAQIESRR